jgi:hypothetical protein
MPRTRACSQSIGRVFLEKNVYILKFKNEVRSLIFSSSVCESTDFLQEDQKILSAIILSTG